MQLAILIVLIIIALVLAPWLLWLAVVALAAYGLWALFAALAGLAVMVGVVIVLCGWDTISAAFGRKDVGNRMSQTIAEVNKQYLAEEEERKRLAAEQLTLQAPEEVKFKSSPDKFCPHCNATLRKYALYCHKCGKDPTKVRKQAS